MLNTKSMNALPYVTVLMSVYNGETWLERSIASVLNQTYSNFEFIIVNDGSQDKTRKIAERYALADSRIRTFHKENTGLADSLNYGLERARGTWVARVDVDDICRPDRLEKQVEAVKRDKELVLIGSGLHIINELNHVVQTHLYPTHHSALLHRLSHALPFFAHSSAFFNLNIAKSVGGYRIQFLRSQDLDLWLRLAECGEIASIDESLISICKHSKQMSSENSGHLQTVYSHIAMAGYWLRRLGMPCPAENNNGQDFGRFKAYVDRRLREARVFETREKIIFAKARVAGTRSQLERIALLTVIALKNPIIIFAYLKNRTIGSSIPRRLAEEWAAQK
jgi:glycosyltransferase involved in cell wall biosynthesis